MKRLQITGWLIIIFLCFLHPGKSFAQTIKPWAITASGKTISNGNIYISYTVGEVFSGALKKENAAVNKKLADLEAKIEKLAELSDSEVSLK